MRIFLKLFLLYNYHYCEGFLLFFILEIMQKLLICWFETFIFVNLEALIVNSYFFQVSHLIIVIVCLIKIRIITSLLLTDENKLLDGSDKQLFQSEKYKNQNMDECYKASKLFAFKLSLLLDKYVSLKSS